MKNSENSKKPLRSKPAQGKTSPARSKDEGSKGKTGRPVETRKRPPGKKTERTAAQGEQPGAKEKRSGGKGLPRKGKAGAGKPEETRLNKYIAHAGICSRREADKLIEAGMVSVNGKVVTELGTKIAPEDDVRYNGERLGNERKVYLLLNKPKDYVTTLDDPYAKKTVMELISKACKERIYPVGRLDKNTTGVLLFTNDGDLTKKLTHPSFNKKKIYQVFLDKNLLHSDMQKIAEGVKLDDGITQVDAIAYTSADSKKEVGLEIHSGKNRVVRRIFEQLGYKVTKLDRVYFAGLTKKNLPRGRWRFLTEKEVKMLKMNAFE
jgi:23S rRNA pseudouridine2605 synthase